MEKYNLIGNFLEDLNLKNGGGEGQKWILQFQKTTEFSQINKERGSTRVEQVLGIGLEFGLGLRHRCKGGGGGGGGGKRASGT